MPLTSDRSTGTLHVGFPYTGTLDKESILNRIFTATLVLALGLLAAGCAGWNYPSETRMAEADYGPQPSSEEYQSAVKKHFAESLFDPFSAVYDNWSPLQRGWLNQGQGDFVFGWAGEFTINAKNRLGGYTGKQHYHALYTPGGGIAAVQGTGASEVWGAYGVAGE